MSELRWHPLLREWVVVAAHRQDRPQMPAEGCPFCPGSGRVPEDYDVYLYPNDFPAFSLDNPPFSPEPGLFRSTGARGLTDVVLYHPNHNLAPSELSREHWRKVVDLWTRRTRELQQQPEIQYVFVFENTGAAIGVTMPHPHGQIYGFPFLPPLAERELGAAREHWQQTGRCLYCDILGGEIADGRRLVAANASFCGFVPFFARWPAEVQIYPRRHTEALTRFSEAEAEDLAALIKLVRMKYDNLYGLPMPLMMILRQSPAKGEHPYFHFHVEFYPIQRSAAKLKYLAGIESGAGTFLNDTVAEERARELRETEPRTLTDGSGLSGTADENR
ncbi:MAG: galactose-1-phosphate uridylyltransferase [Acidobacteria bacterium]|nr:galactose-1-phosphate uridylyltransferase [Acidobacteriota bacterium]